ncbi:MAG: hypothetical protein NUW22_05600 [Acidobacteria bacterium]|nr:hypothetical protein [Acidobacteriota bacterium]
MAGVLGGVPGIFGSQATRFLILPDLLKFLAIAVANLSRFLRQHPELLRLFTGRLGQATIAFGGLAAVLGNLTATLGPLTLTLGLQTLLLRRLLIWGHRLLVTPLGLVSALWRLSRHGNRWPSGGCVPDRTGAGFRLKWGTTAVDHSPHARGD